MGDRSDVELMRASKGDPAAFGELYARHAIVIHAWLRRRVGEPAATDITAETFAAAWAARERFRAERGDVVTPWLYGIAQNQYRMFARHARAETSARARLGMNLAYAPALESDDADARLTAAAEGPSLRSALDHLSDDQRSAVELRVLDDLSFAEIAARIGTTEPNARTRVMRALRSLRASMSKGGDAA